MRMDVGSGVTRFKWVHVTEETVSGRKTYEYVLICKTVQKDMTCLWVKMHFVLRLTSYY